MSFSGGRQGSLPAKLRDSVVLFKADGNIGVPLDKLMSDLKSDGKSLVILSGGTMIDDDGLIKKARAGMDAGVTGFIFGRNIWQRPIDKAVGIATCLKDMHKQY